MECACSGNDQTASDTCEIKGLSKEDVQSKELDVPSKELWRFPMHAHAWSKAGAQPPKKTSTEVTHPQATADDTEKEEQTSTNKHTKHNGIWCRTCSSSSFCRAFSVYRRKHLPGRVRPARPDRWSAEAREMGDTSRDSTRTRGLYTWEKSHHHQQASNQSINKDAAGAPQMHFLRALSTLQAR